MGATWLGQPRGLATLFLTEMWERFTYYGMRAILVLFLVSAVSTGGFGIDDKGATAIYGLYTAGVYLAALPGGWIADRLIGAQRAVIAGGVLITAGNTLLALSNTPKPFYLGLVIIMLGVGLLKPNVSTLVADLYPEGGARRDAGFTVFYIGINLGAALGPFVTAWARAQFGQHAGFAAAAAFMALGVAQFLLTRHHLMGAGLRAHSSHPELRANAPGDDARAHRCARRQLIVGTALFIGLICAVWFGFIPLQAVGLAQTASYLILAVALGFFGYYLFLADLSRADKKRGWVMLVLFLGSVLFWAGYEQAGSSFNLFAERYTDRYIAAFGLTVPTEWFQVLNPAFLLVFAPLVAALWVMLARRGLDPSAPAKFGLAVVIMGSGFLVMMIAASRVAGGVRVSPNWLILTYFLHTIAELGLGPVGLSYFTKLTPRRFVGQMMGIWFLSLSLGNLLAGLIAGQFDAQSVAAMPAQYLRIALFSMSIGFVLLLTSGYVKRLMGDFEAAA